MMQNKIDFSLYRSILCLNGCLPEPSFFHRANLPVIAADGAANQLIKSEIPFELIIGDLDSVDAGIRAHHPFLYCYDQNSNDFQKSLTYLDEKQLLPAVVVGVNGGYLDHILNNISIFLETNSLLYAPPLLGYVIKEESHQQLKLPLNTKLSLMGMPYAEVKTKGLFWELDKHQLSFPGTNSCFNRTIDPTIHISVVKGVALLLVYEKTIEDGALEALTNA